MQNIIRKIIRFLKKALFVILSLIANLFYPSKNEKRKKESSQKEKQKEESREVPLTMPLNTSSNPEAKMLEKQALRFTMTKEELEKKFQKVLKKEAEDLLEQVEKKDKEIKKWYEKTITKVAKEIAKETLKNEDRVEEYFLKEIKELKRKKKIVTEEKNLEISKEEWIASQNYFPTKTEEQIEEKVPLEKRRKASWKEPSPVVEESIKIPTEPLKVQEEVLNEEERKEPGNPPEEKRRIEPGFKRINSPLIEETYILETTSEKTPETLAPEQKLQENKTLEPQEKSPEEKQDRQQEEKKEQEKKQELEEIDLKKIEKETAKLTTRAKKELTSETFLNDKFENVLKELEKKEKELQELLKKPLQESQKQKLLQELQKITKMKNTMIYKKELELESIRITLEESLSKEEKESIIKECMKWNEETLKTMQENLLLNIEKKTQQEIQELEKQLMKQQLQKISNILSFPLFLSIPFVKNKYYRLFVGSFFVFQGLSWIENIIFHNRNNFVLPDLTIVQSGRDALEEYANSLARNKELFKNTKKEMINQYPELMDDEEFIRLTTTIEYNLEMEYQKYNEKTRVVNHYFKKGKKLERKLKRRWS